MNKAEKNRINGRKGGRPRGKKNPATLMKEAVLAEYKQRVMRITNGLLNSQVSLASGQQFLYRIDTVKSGKGCIHCAARKEFFDIKPCLKGKKHAESKMKSERKKPVLVTDQKEITAYLDSLINGEENEDDNTMITSQYYYITTKEPVSPAISDMMNRTYGSPVQSTKLVDDDGKSLPIASINVMPITPPKK